MESVRLYVGELQFLAIASFIIYCYFIKFRCESNSVMESDVTKDGRFSYRQIFFYLSDGQYPPGFSKADKQISWVYEGEPNFSKKKVPTFITVVEVRTYIYQLCF